jgi:hypothetical protein
MAKPNFAGSVIPLSSSPAEAAEYPEDTACVAFRDVAQPVFVPLSALRFLNQHQFVSHERALRLLIAANYNVPAATKAALDKITAQQISRVAALPPAAAAVINKGILVPISASPARSPDPSVVLAGKAEAAILPRPRESSVVVSAVHQSGECCSGSLLTCVIPWKFYAEYPELWTAEQQLAFACGFNRFGKDFNLIKKLVGGKSVKEWD